MHTTLPKTIRTLLMSTLLLSVLATSFVIPPRKVEAGGPVLFVYAAGAIAALAAAELAIFLRTKCPQLNFNASCQNSLSKDGKNTVDNVARKNKLPPMSTDQNVVFYSILLNKLSVALTLIKDKPVPLPQLYTLFTPWLGKTVIQKIASLEKNIKDGFTCKDKTCVIKTAQKIKITRFEKGELFAVCSSYLLGPEKSFVKYCTDLESTFFGAPVTGNSSNTRSSINILPTTSASIPASKPTSCENSSSTSTKNLTEKQKNTIITKILSVLYSSGERSIGINYRAFIESNIADKNKNLINVLKNQKNKLIEELKCLGVTNLDQIDSPYRPSSPILDAKCYGTPCIIILVPSVVIPTYKKPFIGTREEWVKLVNKYNKNKKSS